MMFTEVVELTDVTVDITLDAILSADSKQILSTILPSKRSSWY